MNFTYFAADGSYGDAKDLILVDSDTFTADDWEHFDRLSDYDRVTEACATAYNRDRFYGDPVPMAEDERALAIETLEAVIVHLTANGFPGWGAELGDIRDFLTRGMDNK